MKKYLNSFKQSVSFSSRGAMESGDHFKNGANPKSLTSRRNFSVSEQGADVKQRI
ncbi:MAG: hypothetical protein LBK58_00950 [Prevotellaceae bacterium]|nr:hypothetical protein [Prevotellaceae bacterium]